jgi:exonuclease III
MGVWLAPQGRFFWFFFWVVGLTLFPLSLLTRLDSAMALFDGKKFSISCVNCNSLNMSASAKWNQTLKICGITKLKSDIIFLSDVRISNKNLVSGEDDLKNQLVNNPYGRYNAYFNSTKNKRGVGILINSSLQTNIIEIIKSEDENLLLIRAELAGSEVRLISIYGPNNNDLLFYENIKNLLQDTGTSPVIMGGDWNCTFSSENLPDNIDCLNMARPPKKPTVKN